MIKELIEQQIKLYNWYCSLWLLPSYKEELQGFKYSSIVPTDNLK